MNRIVRSIVFAVVALPAFALAAEIWNIDTAHPGRLQREALHHLFRPR